MQVSDQLTFIPYALINDVFYSEITLRGHPGVQLVPDSHGLSNTPLFQE